MNNKGFMMAEVVVVSAIVLVFLAGLYVSYNKVFSAYQTRVKYYDTTALYDLAYYRDRLIAEKYDTETINKMTRLFTKRFNNAANYYYSIVSGTPNAFQVKKLDYSAYGNDNKSEIVYMVHNLKQKVEVSKFPENVQTSMNESFKDYINYLSTSIEFKSNYIMLMERCRTKSVTGTSAKDKYDCKYAYLEVYDGKEET